MSLDGIICTTVSGIFQHTAQNNLFWVTNWKIQQTGLVEDTWVEGTRSFGNWWWWTEGKTRKKEVIWKGIFKKFRSQLSTPEGRKELDLPCSGGPGKELPQHGGRWSRVRKPTVTVAHEWRLAPAALCSVRWGPGSSYRYRRSTKTSV